MAKKLMTVDQIAQLREIERAGMKKENRGIHAEVQELIDRLTSGGVGSKPAPAKRGGIVVKDAAALRKQQAKVLWDTGFGRELNFDRFEAYLETIPPVPDWPEEYLPYFDEIILVQLLKDEKEQPDLKRICRLLGVDFGWGDNGTFVPYDPAQVPAKSVYWMACQDGERNLKTAPRDCRACFRPFEVGQSHVEGLALFAQRRDVLDIVTKIESERNSVGIGQPVALRVTLNVTTSPR